jgi:AraC-like DNA-binding protein
MDPLSDVLSLLKPRSYVAGGFDVAAPWCIQYARHPGIKCYAVMSGECWLAVEGVDEAVRLASGDCFLLPRGRPFRLASDLSLPPVEASSVYAAPTEGLIVSHNGGGDCFIAGAHFVLGGDDAAILLGVLPPIVHIREEAGRATLRWSMERMRRELREPRPGGYLVAQHLAHMMLVEALRLHLAEGSNGGVGWLFALADRRMSAAIGAMHADPAHRWTLQALAARAGMSRTSFALTFKETVGVSPMDYLARWRMLLAGDRLVNTDEAVSVIARSLGYESESAFSTAFKRVMGRSPRQHGRGQAVGATAPDAELSNRRLRAGPSPARRRKSRLEAGALVILQQT